MALRVPPPEIPVVSFLTPNKSDQGLLEFWNTELASYVPLDIGAPHPNSRLYPNFRLGRQAPVQGDEKWVMRTWITDETNPDWFNWAGKFAGEDAEFPTFIRTYREPRATYTPRTKGEPLKTLYKTVLTENGTGYANGAYPSVEFAESTVTPTALAIAHAVVASDGSITEVVLDFGGEGYEANLEFNVSPPISGTPAKGIAYVQPQKVLLTREEARLYPEDSPFYAQYLQVARVYETIPGPTFVETSLDIDGATLTTATTRGFCSEINTGEVIESGIWCKTTKKPTDIDVICEQVIVCRTLPGNTMLSTKIAEDGKVISVQKTYVDSTLAVSAESLVTGLWTKDYIEDVEGTDLVSWQVVESREVPGNPMVGIKIDKDGKSIDEIRTLKDTTTIVDGEVIDTGVWIKTGKEAVSDLVAWEVVTARPATGNNVLSANVNDDHEVQNITALLRPNVDITPSASESGGFITTVEAKEVSDLESEQVTTVGRWLDKALYSIEIPNLIPQWARPQIPTLVESHILAGTASQPTLGVNEFEASEHQLTKLLYERRVTKIPDTTLPVTATNQELTEEYGGGVLNVTVTLDDSALTIDEGFLVVSSETLTLAVYTGGPPDGLFMKTTKELDDTAWPILEGTEVDPRTGIVIGIEKQVVEAPATGGISGSTYTDVKSIDKWRSITIASTLDAGTLPSPVSWETTDEHSFPNTLVSAVWIWDEAFADPCCYNFDMALETEIDQGYSGPCRALVTESFTVGPPVDVVSITQFFPKANTIGYAWGYFNSECGTCGASARTWPLPPTLHDEITIAGSVILTNGTFTSTIPATDPIALPAPGTLITKSVDVERWRFGVFFRRVTQIYVPG